MLISLLLIPASIVGEKAYGKTEVKSENKADFDLTVKDDLISLNAKEASLKEIMEGKEDVENKEVKNKGEYEKPHFNTYSETEILSKFEVCAFTF